MTKATKAEARYVDHPVGGERCDQCSMWRAPSSCTAVAGDIAARGHCSYWAAKDIKFQGLPLTIETQKGESRTGVDNDGKRWVGPALGAAYGEIKGTKSADGDKLDAYVGDAKSSNKVFVVDQLNADTRKYDEAKILLGFPSRAKALSTYRASFGDGKGAARIGGVKETTVAKFRDWIKDGATTKPAARQAFATGGRVGLASGGAYWGNHPEWTRLSGIERAAAMALLEADRRDFDSAKNALGAMLNRAHREGKDLGEHVSGRIYQPTIEPTQFARLRSVLGTPEHKRLMELAERRMSGAEPDWVQGATHFLAPESQMLRLSSGVRPNPRGEGYVGNSGKYYSWPQWTQYNPAFGYRNVVLRDKSHAFVAPEGRYSADYGSRPTAVAEAPRSNGWQWPALSGSIAFGGEPPRAELPAPMAAGLREVPPVPVERPVARPSVPEFDARSFFDSLDRSSYKSGGTVAMPLIKSGSKAAISANIKSELAAKKPRDQAIAIALSTARRYGKGKAYGGPVGYADGGAPEFPLADMGPLPDQSWPDNPEGADRAIGRGVGAYLSGLGDDMRERSRKPLSAQFMDMAKGLGDVGSNVASVGRALLPDMPDLDKERARMTARPSLGQSLTNFAKEGSTAALGVAPFMPKGGIPAYLGLSATAGLGDWLGPAQASDAAPQSSPLDKLLATQAELMKQKAAAVADLEAQASGTAKDKQGKPIPAGRGPRYDAAAQRVTDIDAQLREVNGLVRSAQEAALKRAYEESPEGKLEAEKRRKAFEEEQAVKERGKPVRENLPGFLQDLIIPAATYAGYRLTKGLTGKANAEYNRALERFTSAQASADVPAMALAQAQLKQLENPGFKQSFKQGAKTAMSALLPFEVRGIEAAIDMSKGKDTRAFQEQSERLHDPYMLAWDIGMPLASSALAYGAGSKMATPYVDRSLGRAIAANPNPYSGSGPLAAGYGQALRLSEDLGRLRQTGPAAPTPAPTALRSSAVEEATVVPPTVAAAPALSPPPAPAAVPSPTLTRPLPTPANEDAIPKLPKGHRWVEAGKGSKVQDTEGNWAKMPKTPKPKTKPEPLTKEKSSKSGTPGEEGEFKRGGLVSRALEVARRYASGGRVLAGPVIGKTDGRGDHLPVDVAAGSYIIPSDCVAALGSGNSLAGMEKLTKMFGKPASRGHAAGGKVGIMISDGEYAMTPEQVAKAGGGSVEQGHKVLDSLVKRIRAEHIKTLSQLPGPAKD